MVESKSTGPLKRNKRFTIGSGDQNDSTMLKLAWKMLRLGGLTDAEIALWLEKLYGAKMVRESDDPLEPNTFVKSLVYHSAYERAMALRELGYGCKKIAKLLTCFFNVRIPPQTVLYWFRGVKPNVVPLHITAENLWCLRYVCGVAVGDYRRTGGGGLKVRDLGFALFFIRCLEELTGRAYKVVETKDRFYRTSERGAWIQYMARSGLWKALAILDLYDEKAWWMAGLIDSEGGVSPIIKEGGLSGVRISLVTGNVEVFNVAAMILRNLGFNLCTRSRGGAWATINGRRTYFGLTYEMYMNLSFEELRRFANTVPLAHGAKRERLEYLLGIAHYSPKERLKLWLRDWTKDGKGRWARKRVQS